MAQGFKGPKRGNNTKQSNINHRNTQMKKGARVIAPKKQGALIKARVTAQLTATLNRRAESALISRIGHEETSLRLVKADERVLEEIKEKKMKREQTRGNGCDSSKLPGNNHLMRSAIERMNSNETEDVIAGEGEDEILEEEEEVFTEDEEFPNEEDEGEEEEK